MITQALLEAYQLDDCTQAEKARVDQALANDPALRDKLDQLVASNQQILAQYTPADQAHFIQGKARIAAAKQAQSSNRAKRWVAVPLLTGALALVLGGVFLNAPPTIDDAPVLLSGDDGKIIAKGGEPVIRVLRRDRSGAAPLAQGQVARQGDVLQVVYNRGTMNHGVIVSLDGAGVVTLHHPASKYADTQLKNGRVALDHGYALDDAPNFERFFFVSSPDPLDVPDVLHAVTDLSGQPDAARADLELTGASISDVVIAKEQN